MSEFDKERRREIEEETMNPFLSDEYDNKKWKILDSEGNESSIRTFVRPEKGSYEYLLMEEEISCMNQWISEGFPPSIIRKYSFDYKNFSVKEKDKQNEN